MENKNYSTVFEADLAYLRSLGDTSECKTEFEVRLKTLRKLGGDIQTTTPLLYEIEKKILDFLGGDSSLYDNIYFLRKAIAEKQGINTEGLHTIYAIAVASLNSEPVDVKYTITFVNYDGTVLETKQVAEGEIPIYTGATPNRESDAEYKYNFSGWSPDIVAATGNATYTAQYTTVKQVYTVKFVNYDGTVLSTYRVAYGVTPSYLGATPVKPSDEEYNYTFSGWLPEISPAIGNVEYVAQFEATAIVYTITFKNYDGTILETQSLGLNEIPVYTGATPVKPSDEEYNYTFNGWLPEISPAIGNVEYVAQFEATAIPVGTNYVTFTAEEAGSTIGLAKLGNNQTLEYSTDTTNWNTMNTSTSISLANTGDKVYIRGILRADNTVLNYTQFKMTGKIAASGNCNAIWNYEDLEVALKKYCGKNMFNGCTALTTAPELPATTLKSSCYDSIFRGCTSLTTTPELPATTLATYCYNNMFYGCTSLTTAPELPATTLATYCYFQMFYGCTSLTTAPELPATTLANYCYQNMFYGCTSLTTAPELPATTLATYCYNNMFYGCTSLTTAPSILPATTLATYCYKKMFFDCTALVSAPELPATTLTEHCYESMFHDCTKINKITCLATDISATDCLTYWVIGVSSTGTFIKDPNMTAWTTGVDGIPDGWTVEDYAG